VTGVGMDPSAATVVDGVDPDGQVAQLIHRMHRGLTQWERAAWKAWS
jgi:hypothetical protein